MKQSNNSLDTFLYYVKDQFKYGGKKYAHSNQKESTDVLFDDFGREWLFGTVAKYTKRYSNLARERDLLKIACYQFITWLKRGFHLQPTGTQEVIDTTVDVKTESFPTFADRVGEYIASDLCPHEDRFARIYELLVTFSNGKPFTKIEENELFEIFALVYYSWCEDIGSKGKDLDTWNEERSKNG